MEFYLYLGYRQYFDHFAVDGLLNKDGFRSVLQCLALDPPQCIVDEMFAEHDKDGKGIGLSHECVPSH
jgi:Ca2+-binding EF-hand superfamily protein